MKKFILIAFTILLASVTFAQQYGVTYTFASTTSKAQFNIGNDNDIYVTSSKGMYHLLKDMPAGTLVSTVIADLTWAYPIGATVAATATITTATITNGTITTATLGGKALTRKDANGGTYDGSLTLATGDTIFAPVGDFTTKMVTPLAVPTQIQSGGTLVADTLHFPTNAGGSRNLYARKKITGISAGDYFVVTPLMASTTAKPGTAEFLGYYCTTDSIVVSRNTASTSNLIVTVIRIKK